MKPASAALILLAATLAGCAHPKDVPSAPALVAIGAVAAVTLPPLLAYKAVDDTFALGPTPRQAFSHPLTGAQLAIWKSEKPVHEIAWRDDDTLVSVSQNSAQIRTIGSKTALNDDFSLPEQTAFRLNLESGETVLANNQSGLPVQIPIVSSTTAQPLDLPGRCRVSRFSDDGKSIICENNRIIELYPIGSASPTWSLTASPENRDQCSTSAHCHRLVIAAANDQVAYADSQLYPFTNQAAGPIAIRAKSGETRTLPTVIPGRIEGLAYSPSGNLLMVAATTGSLDSDIYILDAHDGAVRITLPKSAWGWGSNFRLSNDDRFLCGSAPNSGLLLVDLKSKTQEEFKTGRRYHFSGCSFSPDGKKLAVAVENFEGPSEIAVYALN